MYPEDDGEPGVEASHAEGGNEPYPWEHEVTSQRRATGLLRVPLGYVGVSRAHAILGRYGTGCRLQGWLFGRPREDRGAR